MMPWQVAATRLHGPYADNSCAPSAPVMIVRAMPSACVGKRQGRLVGLAGWGNGLVFRALVLAGPTVHKHRMGRRSAEHTVDAATSKNYYFPTFNLLLVCIVYNGQEYFLRPRISVILGFVPIKHF